MKKFRYDTSFGEEIVVSPKMLSEKEKRQRWKNVWFADVNIEGASIASLFVASKISSEF